MEEKHKEKNSREVKKSEVALAEERILANWQKKGIHQKIMDKTREGKPFVFYDGPPFATGEPHYGHVLAGTIKDTIPRYRTMMGHYVRRQWGWDCHGLPLENIIEKELKLEHKKDIEEYGIENFNEAARKAVLRFDSNWKEIIPRMGRMVDMDLSYKTMDATYSESIWWAFKTLYDKGLIYEGHKIMYVCPRCETPLAQIEVAQGYKDVTDISVTVKFELSADPGVYLLAWTTTPWTLPGNTALAVNPDIEYVKVRVDGEYYILAKDRLLILNTEYEILSTFHGRELVGKSYIPPFDYYVNDNEIENHNRGWKIYGADFVTADSGTGIAHEAPAFGAEDMELSKKENIPVIQHVSMDGKFKPEVKDFAGQYVKQKGDTQSADIEVIKYLAHKGLLFSKEKIVHSYPLCWRCDTPLLNYATPSWFVKTTAISDRVVSENKKVGWIPEHIGGGRFGKWLENPRDWAISRSRFWGAPLPIWKCAECEKVDAFGSVAELSEKVPPSGNRYIVIRHGQSESNALGMVNCDPFKEDHVTDKGRGQVEEAAEQLKKDGIKIDRIISSDFMRTRETAEMVAEILDVPAEHIVFDPRFREINTGIFHDKTRAEYHDFFVSYAEKFKKTPKGGENLLDVKRRVLLGVGDLEKTYRGETILIVTHEYAAWMLASAAKGATIEESVRMKSERGEDFLGNAETEELKWKLIPRNRVGELDLHRPYIDEIVYDCSCGGTMRRIPDVFDCWFESGSMPYAQFHYPFENEKEFRRNFPADFIAEGMDQTRGWFYSLLILGVGLFGESPYKNVIVNGIILAEDGQKMSKRLKNYPDPIEVVNRYGADSLRYFLLSSPLMRGEDVSFSEKGVDEVYKKNIARLNNVYAFYELYRGAEEGNADSKNILDRWILARLSQMINETTSALDSYELDRATKPIGEFIDDLSTWYIRRSRERFKGDDEADKKSALETTNYTLMELSKVVAPFMPFIADDLYLKVAGGKKEESVHLEKWPEAKELNDESREIIEEMRKAREVVSLGLEERAKHGIKVRQPLRMLSTTAAFSDGYNIIIGEELNVKEVKWDKNLPTILALDVEITQELKEEGNVRDIIRAIQEFRKNEGLTPNDKVAIEISAPKETIALVEKHGGELKKAAMLTGIEVKTGKEISFVVLRK
ncbi:MAG: class I tRNA ligase family protein [Candidatus Paceibacterota bacterium]|jgi:isoleucyl-tRNA synthetase